MERRGRPKPRMCPVSLAIFLVVLSLQLASAASENDPYRILGVSRSASQTEIKRAYKNLAKEWWVVQWHQDLPTLASCFSYALQCRMHLWLLARSLSCFVMMLCNLLWANGDVWILFSRHPDKNKDPKAEDMFIKISKSYEVGDHTIYRMNWVIPSICKFHLPLPTVLFYLACQECI